MAREFDRMKLQLIAVDMRPQHREQIDVVRHPFQVKLLVSGGTNAQGDMLLGIRIAKRRNGGTR